MKLLLWLLTCIVFFILAVGAEGAEGGGGHAEGGGGEGGGGSEAHAGIGEGEGSSSSHGEPGEEPDTPSKTTSNTGVNGFSGDGTWVGGSTTWKGEPGITVRGLYPGYLVAEPNWYLWYYLIWHPTVDYSQGMGTMVNCTADVATAFNGLTTYRQNYTMWLNKTLTGINTNLTTLDPVSKSVVQIYLQMALTNQPNNCTSLPASAAPSANWTGLDQCAEDLSRVYFNAIECGNENVMWWNATVLTPILWTLRANQTAVNLTSGYLSGVNESLVTILTNTPPSSTSVTLLVLPWVFVVLLFINL